MVILLLKQGARLGNKSALVLASEAGQTEMLQYLQQKCEDIEKVGTENKMKKIGCVLYKAVDERHGDVVRFLREKGARPIQKLRKGRCCCI